MKHKYKLYRNLTDAAMAAILIVISALAYIYLFKLIPIFNPVAQTIFRAIIILTAGGLILSFTHNWFKLARVKIACFLLLFAFGILVYSPSYIESGSLVDIIGPINSTLSVFFPSRGSYGGENGLENTLSYHLLHILAYLYFAMIVFSIWGRKTINRSQALLYLHKYKNIFWGDSEQGFLLANDIINNTMCQRVIFRLSKNIREDEDTERHIFEKIDSMGAVAVYGDTDNIKHVSNGHRHFFLTEDQDWNVKTALRVIDAIEKKRCKHKVQLYVRTEIGEIGSFFQERITALAEAGKEIEVKYFSQSELTARQYIEKYPMLDCPNITIDTESCKVQGEFNILILGFGWTGREILNKSICDSQFAGNKFSATIVDRDFQSQYGDYPLLYDECIKAFHIKTLSDQETCTVGSVPFYKWLDENLQSYNRIIVALGNDRLNIDTATKTAKLRKKKGYTDNNRIIMAHIRNNDTFSYYNTDNSLSPISIFGDMAAIYTLDIVVNETIDEFGKEMNFCWSCCTSSNKNKEWSKASIFDQNSSRASAMGIRNTLRLLGMEYIKQWDARKASYAYIVSYDDFLNAISESMETLAEGEHLRWNAFHLTSGVKSWPMHLITYEALANYPDSSKRMKANQLKYYNRHAAIVPYDKLPELDKLLASYIDRWNESNEQKINYPDNQENDRQNIRNIPSFLDQLNCIIVKK